MTHYTWHSCNSKCLRYGPYDTFSWLLYTGVLPVLSASIAKTYNSSSLLIVGQSNRSCSQSVLQFQWQHSHSNCRSPFVFGVGITGSRLLFSRACSPICPCHPGCPVTIVASLYWRPSSLRSSHLIGCRLPCMDSHGLFQRSTLQRLVDAPSVLIFALLSSPGSAADCSAPLRASQRLVAALHGLPWSPWHSGSAEHPRFQSRATAARCPHLRFVLTVGSFQGYFQLDAPAIPIACPQLLLHHPLPPVCCFHCASVARYLLSRL